MIGGDGSLASMYPVVRQVLSVKTALIVERTMEAV